MSYTTLVFITFSAEIICCFKILLELVIFFKFEHFVIMVDEHFSTTGALPSQPTLVTRIGFTNPFMYF